MPVLSLSGRPATEPASFFRPEGLRDAAVGVGPLALDLDNTADATALEPMLSRLGLVRIAFPGFSDGRGFSLARRLRQLGYRGRLRAAGRVIPDQRAALLGSGFDEVELSAEDLDRLGGTGVWTVPVAETPFRRRRGRSATPRATAA